MTRPISRYCLGFVFDPTRTHVALVRKRRPAWQAGRLNGIGGKVEPGETPLQAMVREFHEEAGVLTAPEQWRCFGLMHGIDFDVHLFTATMPLTGLRSCTDETIEVWPVWNTLLEPTCVSNLACALSTALDVDAPFLVLAYREQGPAVQRAVAELRGP